MNAVEIKKLNRMEKILDPIYYQRKKVTDANYYYSPRGMHGKTPSFLVGIEKSE